MGEKFGQRFDVSSPISPFIPRGRGVLTNSLYSGDPTPVVSGGDRSRMAFNSAQGVGRGLFFRDPPVECHVGDTAPLHIATSDSQVLDCLTDVFGRLGEQISDAVAAKLIETGVINTSRGSPLCGEANSNCSTKQDVSQLTVHVTADREPVIFRGDNSDKVPVHEWIEMTRTLLLKQKCAVENQADEILSRLMGKARDIVRISLKSDASLDVKNDPDIIYSILLKYFSVAPSCLPLADFYSTLPEPGESAVDYWIRVNKAADLADDGLRRQGRAMHKLGDEVAHMFVKYCPDPVLSGLFKHKPISEWTAKEVQGRLDEYQREQHSSFISTSPFGVTSFDVALNDRRLPAFRPQGASAGFVNLMTSPPAPDSVPVRSRSATVPAQTATSSHEMGRSNENILNRMMGMLEQVMEKVQQSNNVQSDRNVNLRFRGRARACEVCGNVAHSTRSHCLKDKLCFGCFSPGHAHSACPQPQSEN